MIKKGLVFKLFNELKRKNIIPNKKLKKSKTTQKSNDFNEFYLRKDRGDALKFQDEINNELWLTNEGG